MASNAIAGGERTLPYFVEIGPDGRWVFHLDAHMVSLFSECEQKFYYRHVMNLRPKGMPAAMNIGTWWSHVMEEFYKDMAAGCHSYAGILSHALMQWIKLDMDKLKSFHEKAYFAFAKPMTVSDLKSELPSALYPSLDEMDEKNPGLKLPAGAIRMAARYYESYADHDARNWKIIAAEAGFGLKNEVLVYEDDGMQIFWVGKPDLIVFSHSDGQLFPLDHKTTDYIKGDSQKKWKPHSQTAGYIYAVGILSKLLNIDRVVDRCLINLCARNEPSESPRDGKPKPRFTRVYPSYSFEEIEEWKFQTSQKVKRLKWCIENDIWVWKESSCHIYAGCDFRRVDSVKQGSRSVIINADFVVGEPWTPYEVEEDD